MENRNLFSCSVTENRKNDVLDDNPFITKRISNDLRQKIDEQIKSAHKQLKKFMHVKLISLALCFVGVIMLVVFLRAFENSALQIPLVVVGTVVTITGLIMMTIKKSDSNAEQDDSEPVENLFEQVKLELGFPLSTDNIDIIPSEYTAAHGETREKINFAKTIYAVYGYVWSDGENLYISDEELVMTVPHDSILGYRKINKEYFLGLWLKDDDPDSPKYAQYKIKEIDGKYHMDTYYEIVIAHEYENYTLNIPCYDFPVISSLVELKNLDEQ